MHAYEFRRPGKPGVLKLKDLPEPSPKSDEVKVRIVAIGINYAEVLSRKGMYGWAPKRPYIPGMEAFGEVVEVGSEVGKIKVGDQVIVGRQYGCYAEYVCTKAHLCFPAVEDFTPQENAAFLVNFMTAWIALKKMCKAVPGERVLIHAAAGGVGTAAIQIANKLGCKVYGTASKAEKLELIEKLGAHRAINYATTDFYEEILKDGGKVDCILEVVGGDVFRKSLRLLNPFGRIAVVGFASINFKKWNPLSWWHTWKNAPKVNIMHMAKRSYGIHASHIGYLTENLDVTAAAWEELKDFVKENGLRPVVGKEFSFEELGAAHTHMESRASVGKIVVNVSR